jgi:hypothetical protein
LPETPVSVSPTQKLSGESSKAYHAYTIYRDLPPRERSLAEVTRRLALESRGSGLRVVGTDEPKTPTQHTGRIGKWSRQFRWVDRAQAWDQLLDQRLRERQLEAISKMAERHAKQAELVLEDLMQPVIAFARAMRDPNRAVTLETATLAELFKMTAFSALQIPKMQKAERLSRGVKVIDSEPVSAPGSSQGGAQWNVRIHQPERAGDLPALEDTHTETDEWEEK